jgi:hypothetical protein
MKKVLFNPRVSKSQAVYLKALMERPNGTPFREVFSRTNQIQANQVVKEGIPVVLRE